MARPRQVTDEDILRVARDCFRAKGPRVSVEAIALELGITAPAIFKRFGSKQKLLMASMVSDLVELWPDRELLEGPGQGDLYEQLLEIAHKLRAVFAVVMPAVSVMVRSGLVEENAFSDLPMPSPQDTIATLTTWLRKGHEQGRLDCPDPENAAVVLFAAVHFPTVSGSQSSRGASTPDDDDYIDRTVQTFWRAIAPGRRQ